MLCRECGYSEYDHLAGQVCPIGGTLFKGSKYSGIEYRMDTPMAEYRKFETGATRDLDKDKLDYEGFLSPIVLKRYAEYMHRNRHRTDGTLRDSDNWQKGIPKSAYMKSLCRHVMEAWTIHRNGNDKPQYKELLADALCAVIFNAMGYLYEELK